MANTQTSGGNYENASIDTAPGSEGYWTNPVGIGHKNATALFFSRFGGGEGTVSLQYRAPGDTAWTDYLTDETLDDGARFIIEDTQPGVAWRAGVKETNYTNGTIKVSLGWGVA